LRRDDVPRRLLPEVKEIIRAYFAGEHQKAARDAERLLHRSDLSPSNRETATEYQRCAETLISWHMGEAVPPPMPKLSRNTEEFLAAFGEKRYRDALRIAWKDLCDCKPAEHGFDTAICFVAEAAALCDEWLLARPVGEMYLAYYTLATSIKQVDGGSATAELLGPELVFRGELMRRFTYPIHAATLGVEKDPTAPCWPQLLELAVTRTVFRHGAYPRAVEALVAYLRNHGQSEKAQEIQEEFG
jgi:hypothetical protein